MLVIPGPPGNDLCDPLPRLSRRDLLRVGGSGLLGLTLGRLFQLQARAGSDGKGGGPGWGKAKSIILLFLQGGPSHVDLWDPKPDAPERVRSTFAPIATKVPGVRFTELLPRLAQVNDTFTLVRSMSYSPAGLFNHTAAMYQSLTGYTTDRVSPSGALEPPDSKDFPNFGSQLIRLRPVRVPMLPFVMLPRPLHEAAIGKGGTAGFLGKAYDPYTLYPPGDDLDQNKMDRIKVDDLQLRPEVFAARLERRARLRDRINAGMPQIDKAVAEFSLNSYYDRALGLVLSGRARNAFELGQEPAPTRDRYGRNTFGQSCLLARRLVEAGTRVVEVIWPKVANTSDNHGWDHHSDLDKGLKNFSAPMLDVGLSALLSDLNERGLLAETLVVTVGEFGRSPQRGVNVTGNGSSANGRDHWPYCYSAVLAGAGIKRGHVHGESDQTGSSPRTDPVHPAELLATVYHAFGIDPETIVYNHLNQPRELVKGQAVTRLFAAGRG